MGVYWTPFRPWNLLMVSQVREILSVLYIVCYSDHVLAMGDTQLCAGISVLLVWTCFIVLRISSIFRSYPKNKMIFSQGSKYFFTSILSQCLNFECFRICFFNVFDWTDEWFPFSPPFFRIFFLCTSNAVFTLE